MPNPYTLSFFIFLSCGLFTTLAYAEIRYGTWEITVRTSAVGLPVQIPTETYRTCIDKNNLTPGSNENNQSCDKPIIKRENDSVSWSVKCKSQTDAMQGNGKVTYVADSMTGSGYFEAQGNGMPDIKMQINYSGKYIGECKN